VTSGHTERLVEVAAAGTRNVYVGWQTPGRRKGYATYLRRLEVGKGWTGPAKRISRRYGAAGLWPGDTFGLSKNGDSALVSWGSNGEIHASHMRLPAHQH
jgi:hypothetical protein